MEGSKSDHGSDPSFPSTQILLSLLLLFKFAFSHSKFGVVNLSSPMTDQNVIAEMGQSLGAIIIDFEAFSAMTGDLSVILRGIRELDFGFYAPTRSSRRYGDQIMDSI